MNLPRIRRDITNAQGKFDYVEAHSTPTGGLKAMVALQTTKRIYTLDITFPDSYPSAMPKVFVRKPKLDSSPHRYPDDQICYMHSSVWNPGSHDLAFVIARSAKWLSKYEVYLVKRRWPGAGIDH